MYKFFLCRIRIIKRRLFGSCFSAAVVGDGYIVGWQVFIILHGWFSVLVIFMNMRSYFILFIILSLIYGCIQKNTKERSFDSKIHLLPLYPYKMIRTNTCSKLFLINKEYNNPDSFYLEVRNIIDSSLEERKLMYQSVFVEYIIYHESASLDTSFRETKQNGLGNHDEDYIGRLSYRKGKLFRIDFHYSGKIIIFSLDTIGNIIYRSTVKEVS